LGRRDDAGARGRDRKERKRCETYISGALGGTVNRMKEGYKTSLFNAGLHLLIHGLL
jgi:hypothetical protein